MALEPWSMTMDWSEMLIYIVRGGASVTVTVRILIRKGVTLDYHRGKRLRSNGFER